MKKTLFIALLCAVVQGVWAQKTVTTADALVDAVKTDGANIKLGDDIALPDPIAITVKVTIDLNSHKLNHVQLMGHDNPYNCIFTVAAGGELNLSNGTLADANNLTTNNTEYIGGAIVNKGTANLSNVTITNCSGIQGGAILNDTGASLTLTSCTLDGNSAGGNGSQNGGGICNYGTQELNNCTVKENNANEEGGGIWNGYKDNHLATTTINGGSISGNIAQESGGAIANYTTVNINDAQSAATMLRRVAVVS